MYNDEWIFTITLEQLIAALEEQRLSTKSLQSALALRLLCHMWASYACRRIVRWCGRHARNVGIRTSGSSQRVGTATGQFLRCHDEAACVFHASGGGNGHRPLGTNDAATVYNIMRRWNLKFSGVRGENVKTFLLRIKEGHELIPVNDANILRCLPFFFIGCCVLLVPR